MTFAQIQTELRAWGYTIRRTPYGKYRVARIPYVESEAYYTTDLMDAYHTARADLHDKTDY